MLERLYILPMFFHYFLFFNFFNDNFLDPVSQHLMDRSSPKFGIGRCAGELDNLIYHFEIPQGMLLWSTNFWCKIGDFGSIPSFIMLAFRYGLQYCNSDFKRLNGMNFSAFCRNLVRFGPVTPEFYVKNDNFCSDTAKIGISNQIFQNMLDRSLPILQVLWAYGWGWLSWYSFGGCPRDVAMAAS